MLRISLFIIMSFGVLSSPALAVPMFESEAKSISNLVSCEKPKTIKRGGMVFSCTGGEYDTVKLYVSEKKKKGTVKHIKLVWNDYLQDLGRGIHKDRSTAETWLKSLLGNYTTELNQDKKNAFWMPDSTFKDKNGNKFEFTTVESAAVVQRQMVVYLK